MSMPGMRNRTSWLVAFFCGLHLLVLARLWRGSDERVAEGVAMLSVIPIVLALSYLLPRLFRGLTWLDIWALLYAVFSIGSVLLYLQPDSPSRSASYGYGLYHFVLPIACYFAAKSVPAPDRVRLISALVVLNAFAVGYGLLLHFTRPEYYLAFVQQLLSMKGYTEEWQYFARLQSYLGSTSMGYLSAVSVVLTTLTVPRLKRSLPMLAPLFMAGAAFSLQRGSLAGLLVALVYLIFLARDSPALRFSMGVVVVIGLAYGATRFREEARLFRQVLETRATTEMVQGLAEMIEDRGYGPGFAYLRDFPLGVGLGATSSGAASAGLATRGEVADANFMRIGADLGVAGLLLFVILYAGAAVAAWRSNHRNAWLTFLTIHAGIMLATNVLDSFYISHSFWLLLALVDCDRRVGAQSEVLAPHSRPLAAPETAFG